jgi:hypothetical protein
VIKSVSNLTLVYTPDEKQLNHLLDESLLTIDLKVIVQIEALKGLKQMVKNGAIRSNEKLIKKSILLFHPHSSVRKAYVDLLDEYLINITRDGSYIVDFHLLIQSLPLEYFKENGSGRLACCKEDLL